MATNILVPTLGESVTEATVSKWYKKAGDAVKADETLLELETDKVTLEVNAPAAGVLSEIAVKEGETVGVGAILGAIGEGQGQQAASNGDAKPSANGGTGIQKDITSSGDKGVGEKVLQVKPGGAPRQAEQGEPQPQMKTGAAAQSASASGSGYGDGGKGGTPGAANGGDNLSPAVRKIVMEKGIDPAQVQGTGRDGRILKGDVLDAPQGGAQGSNVAMFPASQPAQAPAIRVPSAPADQGREERVRMTRLRQTVARRLKEAQNTAAMLTTFNEVDMSGVMNARNQYKELFEKKHGVKLGFMGFFVKACVHALKEIPSVNAEIDGGDIVFKNYYHIGVAVGTEKGLVVPVLRDADHHSIAGVEKAIGEFGKRARDGKLSIEDMQGGTFTISNGGVYGSLMSTPILNAPQSGILGMHKIQERPVVINGKVEVRPMMYLALSYDHRLVDGKEAVTFLVRVKESLEDPSRMVLDL
ncbi:MAG: 2-oxoglutarate dehydrogenase complex dihydrolipoyllysine-residue succinyltransferase [Hyphomicrobiales bacterium]|nr:2-oxoglutarate dehydrogenase complex dihydrolipoyllysine-residue succinyltransferase [Hyphomicrobiales bacterium]